MSARYEISEGELDVLAITGPEGTRYIDGEEIEARVIRQQSADIAERDAVIAACAGAVGASVSPGCSDEFRAMLPGEIRALVNQLRTDLAAAVAERDRIKGDHDEAAHFARHFIRDDPNITPRGAIIRFGDKCTDLFVRLQQAEARLSAIDSAPVVARPKFIRGEICGCQTRPTHYVGEMDCPWHKRGDGQPKEAKD